MTWLPQCAAAPCNMQVPPPRRSAGVAYDAATGTVVLFGGRGNNGDLADTWTWNGAVWTPICGTTFSGATAACGPSLRAGASMAYDAIDGEIVLFGGDHNFALLGDTWTWTIAGWTQQLSALSPSARKSAAMAPGGMAAGVVLFGGATSNGLVNDTWTWTGSDWTAECTTAPCSSVVPPSRSGAGLVLNPTNNTVVLFGGNTAPNPGSPSPPLGDTWAWNGSVWAQQCTGTSCRSSLPPARRAAGLAYNAADGTILLVGGKGTAGLLADTWDYNGSTWAAICGTSGTPACPAPARSALSLSDGNATLPPILFGGQASANLNDTWALGTPPAPCSAATLTANPASTQVTGQPVALTASASGCSSPQFQYWELPPGGNWTIVQAYTTQATATWNTTGLASGSYSLAVWAEAQGSNAPYEAFQIIPYTLSSTPTPCQSVSLAASPATSAAVGTSVALSALATGCPSPEYEFWTLPPAGAWTILQAYAGQAMASWNTSGLAAGSADIAVWAKDASSSQPYDTFQIISPFTLTPVCSGATLSANPSSPQGLPASVTFTATSMPTSGATCRYEFWGLPIGANWVVAQAFSTSNTFQWTVPAGTLQGVYQLAVWAEAEGSATPSGYDSFAIVPYTLGCAVTLAATPPSPANGANVTFSTTTSGICSTMLQYQWWALPPGGQWGLGVAYPGVPTLTVSSTGVQAGQWVVAVLMRAAGSSAAYDSYAMIPYTFNAPSGSTRRSAPHRVKPPNGTASRVQSGPGFPAILPNARQR